LRLDTVQELQDSLNNNNFVNSCIIPNLEMVMDMICKNIFRPLPTGKKANGPSEAGVGEEEDIPIDNA